MLKRLAIIAIRYQKVVALLKSSSSYTPIKGNLSTLDYGNTLEVEVSDFSNGMESINLAFYIDGKLQDSQDSILEGSSVKFDFPYEGNSYKIRMSTFSLTSGTCYYNTKINKKIYKTKETLPKAGNTASTYTVINGTLNPSIYNRTIEIAVSNFSNGMKSTNLGLYIDGIFQGSEESISDGGSASFSFPSSGKSYEIRMSTYSATSGTCNYSYSIK